MSPTPIFTRTSDRKVFTLRWQRTWSTIEAADGETDCITWQAGLLYRSTTGNQYRKSADR